MKAMNNRCDLPRYLYSNQVKEALDRAIPLELNTQYPTHRTGACGELVAYDVLSRSIYWSENDIAGSIIGGNPSVRNAY
jgi:hypothetical protein